jgi:hypothetical protein
LYKKLVAAVDNIDLPGILPGNEPPSDDDSAAPLAVNDDRREAADLKEDIALSGTGPKAQEMWQAVASSVFGPEVLVSQDGAAAVALEQSSAESLVERNVHLALKAVAQKNRWAAEVRDPLVDKLARAFMERVWPVLQKDAQALKDAGESPTPDALSLHLSKKNALAQIRDNISKDLEADPKMEAMVDWAVVSLKMVAGDESARLPDERFVLAGKDAKAQLQALLGKGSPSEQLKKGERILIDRNDDKAPEGSEALGDTLRSQKQLLVEYVIEAPKDPAESKPVVPPDQPALQELESELVGVDTKR